MTQLPKQQSFVKTLLLFLLCGLLLVACGSEEPTPTAEPAPTEETEVAPTESAESVDSTESGEEAEVVPTEAPVEAEEAAVPTLTWEDAAAHPNDIEFVTIPATGELASFQMQVTEVTNEQYVTFLNEAFAEGLVTMEVPDKVAYTVDTPDPTKLVYNLDGDPIINLGGSRVVKDHNKDGEYERGEMENPLNRVFVEFNEETQQFQVVDPATVDWTVYFDTSIYPNVTDFIEDWAELNEEGTGRYEFGDLDKELPTLEEVKQWPVTFVRYWGAHAFAEFYGYEIPTQDQWHVAAKGGQDFAYPTNNGEYPNDGDFGANPDEINTWFSPHGFGVVPHGHVQPVKSIASNPFGLYSMGGSVWEWTHDWYKHNPEMPSDPFHNTGGLYFVDDSIPLDDIRVDTTQPLSKDNQYSKTGAGGAYNFPELHQEFSGVMQTPPKPFLGEANDHFGFRVVINSEPIASTPPRTEWALSGASVEESGGQGQTPQIPSFSMVDANQDGEVTLEELVLLEDMLPFGAEQMFNALDKDKNGVLTEGEFPSEEPASDEETSSDSAETEAPQMPPFSVLDQNKDGEVTEEELTLIEANLPFPAAQMLNTLDKDKNGVLTEDELVTEAPESTTPDASEQSMASGSAEEEAAVPTLTWDNAAAHPNDIEFVTVQGEGDVVTFEMAATETTNEQYVAFLNEAWAAGVITFDIPDHVPTDPLQQIVYNLNGQPLIDLGGYRVVQDHNRDGTYALEETESPLNRSFIQFDEATEQFSVVDPASVDWNIYFDTSIYPNVVDTIELWAELNGTGEGWYDYGDLDKALPTLEEVTQWPVSFIRYYGAHDFAEFYGYAIPTQAQWQLAAKGGQNFKYATNDGEAPNHGNEGENPDEINAWFNILGVGNKTRGHLQPAKSLAPNPLGIYSLGGSIWEWTRDWYRPDPTKPAHPFTNTTGERFVDDSIPLTDIRIDTSLPPDRENQYFKTGAGGSFNFPAEVTIVENASNFPNPDPGTGNDHFGFRVIREVSGE